jgi:predicted nucleic acid-binding protein
MILTLDNEYSAVLDACVLAPMPLCDTLLRCAEEPALFRLIWSDTILEEVHGTLNKRFGHTIEQCDYRIQKMREAFPEACVVVPDEVLLAIPDLPDPKDKHVIAVAIKQNADAIVTSNLRHFPPDVMNKYGILVHCPDDFLVHQYHLNPEPIMDLPYTQASGIRQQRKDIVERLRLRVPKFAALINPPCRNA